ncbi:MAG: 50S ribosomal protein L21 [Varibaculum sp.]|nr:50S ribosomal protein L21 [Varibaculum sp.]
MVYAIVKAGGRQEKVAVGDTIKVNSLSAEVGDKVQFDPVMIVDGDKVTSDPKAVAKVKVTGELIGDALGPKIRILKFKNKTGYKKRQGHRQPLSVVKITEIA